MRIKKALAIFSLAVTIIVGLSGFITRAQSASSTLDGLLPSTDVLLGIMDDVARGLPSTTVYDETPKIIYAPGGTTNGARYLMVNGSDFRNGIVRIIIDDLRKAITGEAPPVGATVDYNKYTNTIVAALQSECITQCRANMAASRSWGSRFVAHIPSTCSCGGEDGGSDCCCGSYRCGYGDESTCGTRAIYSNVCEEFHCAVTPSDSITLPYSEVSFDKIADHIERYTTSSVPSVCGWDGAVDKCNSITWTIGQPAPNYPSWCTFQSSADQPKQSQRFCIKSDYELKCLQDAGLAPQLLTASNTTMSYLVQLIGNFSADGTNPTGFLGAIQDEYSNLLGEYLKNLTPNLSGGSFTWDQSPNGGVNYADMLWGNQTGECYNQAVGGCSCADVLPINSKTLKYDSLQRILHGWKVANPAAYCVNSDGENYCAAAHNWQGSKGSDVGFRNIFSSRASYPGVYHPQEKRYYQGGLCAEDDKSSGSGDGGSDAIAYTDADFWYHQARYHEENFRIKFPLTVKNVDGSWKPMQDPGTYDAAKYNKGQEKLLGDYGGCDDRSNILFTRNTTAECEEKSSSSPKCDNPTPGGDDYASWACAEDGSVIDQCSEGFANGRNTSCQVCGPILCGTLGLFSDTNTVRKDLGTDNPTRHYGFFETALETTNAAGIRVENIDRTQIPSYRTIGCEGGNCDLENRDDLSQIASEYGITFDDSMFGNSGGQVIHDRTCQSEYGETWIVDPCAQVNSDNDSRLRNNWNGSRMCYSACCEDKDLSGSCDEYEVVPGYEPGTCGPTTDAGVCSQTRYDQLGDGYYRSYYAYATCAPADLIFHGARTIGNPDTICTALGATDWRSGQSVGEEYSYTLGAGATTNCYLCGCGQIGKNTGKSGWWPENARFAYGQPNNYPATPNCSANEDAGLTPVQKCEEVYPQNSIDGTPGFLGLAYARDRDGTNLLRSGGAYGQVRTNCVRCRCVADDGICDGCYPSDPEGLRPNDPRRVSLGLEGSCTNFPWNNGLDPDCGGSCPADVCVPEQCFPGTVCKCKDGSTPTPDPYASNNGPGCGYCPSEPGLCEDDNNSTCDVGESCSNCPSDCGPCVNAVCPDGYGPLCEGDPYPNPSNDPNLANCRRCQTPIDYPNNPDDDGDGCDDNDGYCNPLCEAKDDDCEPLSRGCPIGYELDQDGCGGSAQNSNSPLIGSSHPLYQNCCMAEAAQCTPEVVNNSVCETQGLGGIDWVPMLRADQESLYRWSLCYGYQLRPTITEFDGMYFNDTVYDYYQEAAWMDMENSAFGDSSPGVYRNDSHGGYRRCRPPMNAASGNDNCEVVCVPKDRNLIVMSCSEIDARYPDEFGFDYPTDGGTYIFLPDMARSAGNNEVLATSHTAGLDGHVNRSDDKRCGRYYRTYSGGGTGAGPTGVQGGDLNGDGTSDWKDANEAASYIYTDWWQAGGSAYGNTGVGNYGEGENRVMNPGDFNTIMPGGVVANPATSGYVQNDSYQYALAGGLGICEPGRLGSVNDGNDNPSPYNSYGSGLQVTGDGLNSNPTSLQGYRTYRDQVDRNANDLAADSGYTYQVTQQRALNWQYYTTKFDYGSIGKPGSKLVGNTTVYRLSGTNLDQVCDSYDPGQEAVFFIEGNLTVSQNMPADCQPGNGYLALIISGNLIIEEAVGYPLTVDPTSCELNKAGICTPSLDAVVVAQGLEMKTARNGRGVDTLFNEDNPVYCDNRLVLSGSYSFWGDKPIVFTRSLLGCGFKRAPSGGVYPNGTDTLNMQLDDNGNPGSAADKGLSTSILNKNRDDQYCRTSGPVGFGQSPFDRNGNGYWDYKPYATSGMYNNYNRLFPATQIISNPGLISRTPLWMRENSSTRLEVQ